MGNKILDHAFTEAGYKVVNLGVMVSQDEFIKAAIETNADAIMVSSLDGLQGELDCQGMREKCVEAGIGNIPLFCGGNLVVGKRDFKETEKIFKDMGFNYVSCPRTTPGCDHRRPAPGTGRIRRGVFPLSYALFTDIGSTFTKVTAADLEACRIVGRAMSPTTIFDDVNIGFQKALALLTEQVGQLSHGI